MPLAAISMSLSSYQVRTRSDRGPVCRSDRLTAVVISSLARHAGVAEWQTRMVQVHVGATPWRFKSSHPHHRLISGSLYAEGAALSSELRRSGFEDQGPDHPSHADKVTSQSEVGCISPFVIQINYLSMPLRSIFR